MRHQQKSPYVMSLGMGRSLKMWMRKICILLYPLLIRHLEYKALEPGVMEKRPARLPSARRGPLHVRAMIGSRP
jgi:hypothetical protein